ncbi:hypothetical protein [Qipengyuania sp. RANM35]|uniref:hypothetical protein n=1 Tax=Qipengyuania sp. RANM35 TaxID=3068635 RepID=UPI0034DAD5E0
MKASWLIGGAALALTSTLVFAQDAPEDLLPPGFDNPAPAPRATPAPSPGAPRPAPTIPGEVVQPLPTATSSAPEASGFDFGKLPTLEELEKMTTDELDDFLGLKPKFDIPAAARRSPEKAGVIALAEGGLPSESLSKQPAALVRAALAGTKAPLVSRWGHILLRRALASRLAAPEGMSPIEFATLRARVLNTMGEHGVARALVQDIDTANYSPQLANAAVDAYIGTADIVGACPAVRLVKTDRDDAEWKMLAGICNAYAGEETRGLNDLRRLQSRGEGAPIDVLLAQRFAGAAGEGRRAVTIEWDGIDKVTPWRFALANALGEPLPKNLTDDLGDALLRSAAVTPALSPTERLRGADVAAQSGIFSSAAMVDLYSQLYAEPGDNDDAARIASRLRDAYVGSDPAARLAAIRDVWNGAGDFGYARMVLTAYAAARMPAQSDFADDAGELIASMLTAGLDRDAMRWNATVEEGSLGWALLALAEPKRQAAVSNGELDSFVDDDPSTGQRKSRMLVAGLAGLGRVGDAEIKDYSDRLSMSLGGETRWTRAIDAAAKARNPALVAILAGLGMQGDSWDRMTARHLFHIVSALRAVGLEAEARMIAAEAVARA